MATTPLTLAQAEENRDGAMRVMDREHVAFRALLSSLLSPEDANRAYNAADRYATTLINANNALDAVGTHPDYLAQL